MSNQMFKLIMRCDRMKYTILWVVLALVCQVPPLKSCMEEERLALYELKSYMKSQVDPNNMFDSYSGWLEGPIERYNCCAWDRVLCNPLTRRVMELDLNGVVFRIENPPWLFNFSLFLPFTELRRLDLSSNTITGLTETKEFTKLTKLQALDLSSNSINGSMRELANLKELRKLNLEGNMFSGTIQGICTMNKLLELNLYGNHFHGIVPSCLHNLSTLQVFDISMNNFEGEFPKMVLNITSLRELSLSDNYFEGKLSLSSFANHSKLQWLELSRNSLEIQTEDSSWYPTFQLKHLGFQSCSLNKPDGTFPKFLSYQHSLSTIDLSNNSLIGHFPYWLLNNNSKLQDLELTNNSLTGRILFPNKIKPFLQSLAVGGNQFQGKMPRDIGFLFPNLGYLDMSRNHFEGAIPSSISKLGLGLLDLSHNNFSGELPRRLLSHCSSLVTLKLSYNNLQGEITPEHMNLPYLTLLQLSNNHFGGTIKDSLQISSSLISLDISNNEVMGELPKWIGNFISLKAIIVSNNSLQGQIPLEICNLQLSFLDLSQNNFTGSMPSCSNFSSIMYMHLHKNKLQGSIPNALSSCSSLQALDLRDNLFSGSIPTWINKLSSLRVLLLRGNNLHGKIPHQMCQLANMNILDLSQNRLFGRIPTCLWNVSFGRKSAVGQYGMKLFSYDFDIETNHYFIQETVEILAKHEYLTYAGGNRLLMSGLDLSCNNLSGIIPPELGNLTEIHSLNLSHNYLLGSIPNSFSNLKQVEGLDLSYNNLSGNIPPQLIKLNFLAIFNVSYNNLRGRTPETGQFANFDESSYLGNPGLCGFSLNKSCSPVHANALHPPPIPTKKGGYAIIDMEDFWWSFGPSSVIALLATLVVLGINPQWREAWFDFVDWHVLRWFL